MFGTWEEKGGSHKMKCFRQRTVGATQKDRYSSDCFVYCKGIKLMQDLVMWVPPHIH